MSKYTLYIMFVQIVFLLLFSSEQNINYKEIINLIYYHKLCKQIIEAESKL